MNRTTLLILSCLVLAACEQATEAPPTSDKTVDVAETPIVTGKDAYEKVCADCHEAGRDGAPRTDHPEDWAGRSRLWQAVLYEHAKHGYMDMPAKGGDDSLHESVVAAAAEYMLERTHTNLPPDQLR